MSNELNITIEEVTESTAASSTGENKGVIGDNKIVPIANKQDTAVTDVSVSDNADAGGALAAQVPTVAAQASDNSVNPAPAATAPASDSRANPAPAASAQASDNSANPAPATQASDNLVNQAAAAQASDSPAASRTPAPEKAPKPEANTKHTYRTSSYTEDTDSSFDFDEDERPKRRFFRSKHEERSRDQLILSRIRDEDLMEYLALEQRRLEFLQQAKEIREKRILTAFQLLISLAAIVAVTYLLKDNPTILISILYIVGIIAALNIWKNPSDKRKDKRWP